MSPRPRTIDDGQILAALARVMGRLGPARLTLAEVAREAGLAPATLVQRFGSKRGMLLAFAELGTGSVEACFDAARAAYDSPLDALLEAALTMPRIMATPEEVANGVAFLHIDLSDDDFYRLMLENTRRTVEGYRRLLDEAVAAGELAKCDTAGLARGVNSMVGGSLIGWAVLRKGSSEDFVRGDLTMLLAPYRAAGRRTRAPKKARGARRRV